VVAVVRFKRPGIVSLAVVVLGVLWFGPLGPSSQGRTEPAARIAPERGVDVATLGPAAEAAVAAPVYLPGFPAPAAWAPAPQLKSNAVAPPDPAGLAAVILDEASGEVIYDRNAHWALPPASLTKIATLILALEHGNLDAEVVSDVEGASMRGSSIMGLEIGDRFTLRDLLYGLMLPSGNDAALVIGRHIAGSDEAFVGRMNELLLRLGLQNSHFANPHGLGRGSDHVASAYELAALSRYGMTLPGFFEIVNARTWTASGSRVMQLRNINSFLWTYAGADGIKTGYTRGAGPTLAASAWRNGRRLYVVVLNSPSREDDARRLLNWAYANFEWRP
jgi:D-alanyl-D-alanine carboxypeptidase (penicillin-binding protein 5/6)